MNSCGLNRKHEPWMSERIEFNAADSFDECHYTETGMYQQPLQIDFNLICRQTMRSRPLRERYFKQILHKSNVKPKQITAESVVFSRISYRQEIGEARRSPIRQNASQPFLMSHFSNDAANIWTSFATEIDKLMENCRHFTIFILSDEWGHGPTNKPPEANNTRLQCCLLIRTNTRELNGNFAFQMELNSTSWHWDHSESLFLSFHFIDCSDREHNANISADSPLSDLLRFPIYLNRIHNHCCCGIVWVLLFLLFADCRPPFESTYRLWVCVCVWN